MRWTLLALLLLPGVALASTDPETGSEAAPPSANAAPVLASLSIGPDRPRAGDTLKCSAGDVSDPDGDLVSVTYRWQVNGAFVALEGDELPPTAFRRGDQIACEGTPSDGAAWGKPVLSATVTILNQLPVLAGVRVEPPEPLGGADVNCIPGGAADADGDPVSFRYAWTVSGRDVGIPRGTLEGTLVRGGARIECMVTPHDGHELGKAVRSGEITVRNTPPTADPPTLGPAEAATDTTLVCTPGAASDPDDDLIEVRYLWKIGTKEWPGSDDHLTGDAFGRGDTVVCAVVVSDGVDSVTVESAPVEISNSPPVVGTVHVEPESPQTTHALTCVPEGPSDPDEDQVSFTYAWKVDGRVVESDGASLAASTTAAGRRVGCSATPSDGDLEGTTVHSEPVVVGNTPPVLADVALSPAEPTVTDALVCESGEGSDADGDPVTFRTRWIVSGEEVELSKGELRAPAFHRGDVVQCAVSPHDGHGSGAEVLSAEVTVQNSPPALGSARIEPATAFVDTPLACVADAVADADGDTVEVRFAWTVDETPVGTSATLAPGSFRKGQEVGCTATPSDGTDDGAPITADAVSIHNSVPTVADARVAPGSPRTSDDLTCVPGAVADRDGDQVVLDYTWTVDGRPVDSDGARLPASATAADRKVACSVTPSDGDVEGSTVSSEPVVVENTPPVLADVALSPTDPTVADALVCESGEATDVDGDRVTFRTQWTVSGETVDPSGSELRAPAFQRGDTVRCAVSPFDGRESGKEVMSSVVIVRNSPPELSAARIEPPDAYADLALTCRTDGGADPDGDEVEVRFGWTADQSPLGTSATLASGSFRKGQELRCTATPFDGTDEGAPVSHEVVVRNRPPVVEAVELAPEEVFTDDKITASATAKDADGDPVTLTWRWSVNGRGAEVDGNEIDGSLAFSRGDRVQATAEPHDGEEAGKPMASAVVQVRNSRPGAPQIAIDDPKGGKTNLVCRIVEPAADPDGDRVRYRFEWMVDKAPYSETRTTVHSGDTVPRSALGLDEDWTCVVTPRDDREEGPPSEPDTVTIVRAQVGSGSSHACALRTTGDLVCWGNRDYGMNRPPTEPVRQLAVGGWHNCAIRQRDRGLECWGHNVYGQSRPPNGPFRRVTAGGWHSCALDMDLRITCWGQGAEGRTEAPVGLYDHVSAGWNHTCAIATDGGLVCWGNNEHGQSDAPEGRFRQVSAGEFHSCGLAEDGGILCWGSNRASELDAPPGPFVAVEVGARFTCGMRSGGAVECWGMDNYGQLGVPERAYRHIGRGVNNLCGWTAEETLECWGQDQYGQSRPPR
jgi:hypothetical protein